MRFYFHLYNASGWTYDQEGRELDGATQARKVAFEEARSILAYEVETGETIDLAHFISVDDENGREVARITFGEVVKFVGQ